MATGQALSSQARGVGRAPVPVAVGDVPRPGRQAAALVAQPLAGAQTSELVRGA